MLRKIVKATTKCLFEVEIGNHNGPISRSKVYRKTYRGKRNTDIAIKKKTRKYSLISGKTEIHERKLVLDLPIRTVSEANCFEPWQVKHGRHKEQKRLVALGLNPLKGKVRLPCTIMLTRFAPDELDAFDNLPVSFKYIVDAVCAIITGNYVAGRADSDKRISITCDQVKSDAYGIRIEILW
jgi:hypothetical protein